MVEWEVFYDHFNAGQRLSRQLDSASYIFFNCGSYGDVYPNMALLENVAEYQNKKIIVLLDKRWEKLVNRFSSDRVSCVLIDSEQHLKNALMSERRVYRFEPGSIYPLLPTMHPLLDSFYFQGFVTDLELKKIILHLPITKEFTLPELSAQRKNEIIQIFKSTGCRNGKTFILSFNNNSSVSVSAVAVKKLAQLIKSVGFDVLINSAQTFGQDKNIETDLADFKNISLPADAPIEFVELAGYHIGTTNGLSQILYMFKNKAKTVAAVNTSNKKITVNGWTVEAEWLLKMSNCLGKHANIDNCYTEVNFSNDDFDAESLLNWISKW
jgi:hypothetical protein